MDASDIVAFFLILAKYLVLGVTILLSMVIIITLFKPARKDDAHHARDKS